MNLSVANNYTTQRRCCSDVDLRTAHSIPQKRRTLWTGTGVVCRRSCTQQTKVAAWTPFTVVCNCAYTHTHKKNCLLRHSYKNLILSGKFMQNRTVLETYAYCQSIDGRDQLPQYHLVGTKRHHTRIEYC